MRAQRLPLLVVVGLYFLSASVDGATKVDANKVKADADGFALSDDYKAVDVVAIQAAL